MSKKFVKPKDYNLIFRADFLTPKARITFTKLKQAFIETPILSYFDLQYYIQINTNVSKSK